MKHGQSPRIAKLRMIIATLGIRGTILCMLKNTISFNYVYALNAYLPSLDVKQPAEGTYHLREASPKIWSTCAGGSPS
jgi:hypothetical protein